MPKALITPPAVQPVTLAEVKAHLRVETADEDEYLNALAAMAVAHVEQTTGLALINQVWRVYLDAWPLDGLVELPVAPVRAVVELRVYDAEGTPIALSPGHFTLDPFSEPARLLVNANDAPERAFNGIEIDVEAGYGESGADVPDTLRRAILVLVAHWHELRGAADDAVVAASAPPGFARLLAPFTRPRL